MKKLSHEKGIIIVISFMSIINILFNKGFFLINDSEKLLRLAGIGPRISILVLFIFLFNINKVDNIIKRSLWMLIILFQLFEVFEYIFVFWYKYCENFGYYSQLLGYFVYENNLNIFIENSLPILFPFILVISIFHIMSRPYTFKNDSYHSDKVYICFYRATRWQMVLFSLVGYPLGSVAVYTNERLYNYGYTSKVFMERHIPIDKMDKNYVIINTGRVLDNNLRNVLNGLVGTKARRFKTLWFRCSCLLTLKPFLKELGKEFVPKLMENNPSVYFHKVKRVCENG